ncbi:hypothetical protein [Jiangella asiatica]|uniref:Uncharacterized protein n=1 Tax=Jiangella asiatica TaxID=2530372 RepID=A0A4R5DBX1_9ACTN|nr:hypothetical protein [Jiangella asiatica]TDE10417.1 hypothetical protein E1269_12060 [Jiangella asiatica]
MTDPAGRHRTIVPAFSQDDPRYAIGRVLLVVCAAVMTLHVVAVAARSLIRPSPGTLADILALLNAAQERSVASWWTAALLVASCATATVVARLAADSQATARVSRSWLVLAVVFALLSFDEVVSLHERGARWTASVFDTGSLLASLGWTIPAAAVIVASLLVLIPAFRAIPFRPRGIIVGGLALSIAGALGMEVVNVLLTEVGVRYLWRHLVMAVEEAAEMTGVVMILLGMLSAVRASSANGRLTLAYDDVSR